MRSSPKTRSQLVANVTPRPPTGDAVPPPPTLSIDTSTRYAGVAAGGVETVWHSRQNHTRELLGNLFATLRKAKLDIADIGGIVVAVGPGGFSAVRVGLATALGLAMPKSLPLVGINTLALEVASANMSPQVGAVVASVPFGRHELSWALFKNSAIGQLGTIAASGVAPPSEVAAIVREHDAVACGEGAPVLRDLLEPSAIVTNCDPPTRRPSLLEQLVRAGVGVAPEPIYARPPTITIKARSSP